MPTTPAKKPLAYVGMKTPWGRAITVNRSNDMMAFVSTGGHGGYKLSPAANKKVHEAWRKRGGWYEEDCEWAIVALTFPEKFSEEAIKGARATAKNYFPDAYEAVTGEKVTAAESHVVRKREFDAANAGNLVVIAAWGDWNKIVPKGMVGVAATLGGQRGPLTPPRYFLVPEAEYNGEKAEFGFVVDPAKHAEIEKL